MAREYDSIKVKDQLGKPDNIGIFGPFRLNNIINMIEGPVVAQTVDINNAFVLDHPVNGELDSAVFELDTGLGTQTPYYMVSNKNNIFKWKFTYALGSLGTDGQYSTLGMIDTSNTTATVDTVTDYNVTFTSGQVLQTTSIYKDPTTTSEITAATLGVGVVAGSFDYELSADGGSNWQTATLGSVVVFSVRGYDLRIRITENATSTGTIDSLTVEYERT